MMEGQNKHMKQQGEVYQMKHRFLWQSDGCQRDATKATNIFALQSINTVDGGNPAPPTAPKLL